MEKKTKRLWIRLSPEEEALFKRKAARYSTVSAMVRDAVKQFDDTATVGQIDALNKMTDLYLKFQQDLSWLGGNFNQTMKRANELAINHRADAYVGVVALLVPLLDGGGQRALLDDEEHLVFVLHGGVQSRVRLRELGRGFISQLGDAGADAAVESLHPQQVADVLLVADPCYEGVDLFECRHNVFFL